MYNLNAFAKPGNTAFASAEKGKSNPVNLKFVNRDSAVFLVLNSKGGHEICISRTMCSALKIPFQWFLWENIFRISLATWLWILRSNLNTLHALEIIFASRNSVFNQPLLSRLFDNFCLNNLYYIVSGCRWLPRVTF